MLLVQRQSTDGTVDVMTRLAADPDDGSDLLRDEIAATANSSIPYESVRSGRACQPLSFPAPVVDGAVSVSADVVDHTTGDSVRRQPGR